MTGGSFTPRPSTEMKQPTKAELLRREEIYKDMIQGLMITEPVSMILGLIELYESGVGVAADILPKIKKAAESIQNTRIEVLAEAQKRYSKQPVE